MYSIQKLRNERVKFLKAMRMKIERQKARNERVKSLKANGNVYHKGKSSNRDYIES